MRKPIMLVAIAAVTLVSIPSRVEAQRVTVLLRSGDRVSGDLASFDQSTMDIRASSGQRSPVRWNDVVLLDFASDARSLPDTERPAASRTDSTIILDGGQSLHGRVVDFVNEGGPDAAVVFAEADRGQQTIRLDRVGRIYVSTFTPQALSAAGLSETSTNDAQTGASVQTDASGTVTVTVPGNSRWVATGLFVRNGERVLLSADGTVYLRSGSQDPARPAGALAARSAPGAPLPALLAGALIGRVGERGVPFGIGDQTSIPMPAAGQFYLGINDDELSDNSGSFSVRITRSGTSSPRN